MMFTLSRPATFTPSLFNNNLKKPTAMVSTSIAQPTTLPSQSVATPLSSFTSSSSLTDTQKTRAGTLLELRPTEKTLALTRALALIRTEASQLYRSEAPYLTWHPISNWVHKLLIDQLHLENYLHPNLKTRLTAGKSIGNKKNPALVFPTVYPAVTTAYQEKLVSQDWLLKFVEAILPPGTTLNEDQQIDLYSLLLRTNREAKDSLFFAIPSRSILYLNDPSTPILNGLRRPENFLREVGRHGAICFPEASVETNIVSLIIHHKLQEKVLSWLKENKLITSESLYDIRKSTGDLKKTIAVNELGDFQVREIESNPYPFVLLPAGEYRYHSTKTDFLTAGLIQASMSKPIIKPKTT